MSAGQASPEPVRGQLEKILASPGFARNERLSGFLRFVVEKDLAGQSGQLKESVIGVNVFGRRPDYNPRQDPVVRTEAAKLRARLAEYYASDGAADPLIIEVPKGGYVPAVRLAGRNGQVRARPRWLIPSVAAAAVLALAVGAWRLGWPLPESKTIAVLPFENRSAEPASEYFSDGLTDEIIQNLSAIEGLEVRSRTTSFALKGKPRNLRELGGQLAVNYVLEGSVARAGGSLHINVRLVRVRDDRTLWSGKFDREARDVFAIQDEISRNIVNQLRLNLGGGQRRYNTNVEAYELYLKARSRLDYPGGGIPGWRASIELLEKVLAKDPSFAPAYAGLAKAYTYWSSSAYLEGVVANPKIRAYSDKALELDPLLAEAWSVRGVVLARDYLWAQAEKAFQRALELNPNFVDAHLDYAWDVVAKLGRQEEALGRVRRAAQLDPLAPRPPYMLAHLLANAGRPEEAWKAFQRFEKLQPQLDNPSRTLRARLLMQKGRVTEAIAGLEGQSSPAWLGYAYGLLGRRDEAQQLREAARAPSQQALICAGLQDKDCVIEALNGMADVRDPRVHHYLIYPEMALVRGDSRLEALRKKVGL